MAESGSAGRALPVAAIAAILWLGAAGWALFSDAVLPLAPRAWVEAIALLFTPVAALFALAAALNARGGAPAPHVTAEGEAEADLAGTVTRLQALRDGLAADVQTLNAHGAALEQQCAAARGIAAELTAAGAAASGDAQTLRQTLAEAESGFSSLRQSLLTAAEEARGEAARTGEATGTLATALADTAAQGRGAADTLAQGLERLAAIATEGRARSESGVKLIRTEADQLFELLENSLTARRETLRQQGDALGAQLEDGWKRFESMAAAAAGKLEQRLDALTRAAQGIEDRLNAQLAATENLAQSGERSFQLLDARLQHSGQSTHNALDRLAGRVQQVNSDLAGLTAPLKDTESASKSLESAVASLRETTLQTVDVLGETLPQKTVEAARASETLQAELRDLVAAIDAAHDRALALSQPLGEGRAAIDAASDRFMLQREAIETAGQALVVELNQARNLMAEVEEQTRDTSLAAATRLVDAMSRVREVATQATGTMRDMLDGLLTETRDSLSATAGEAMRASFTLPVAEKAREAEAAATAAAERTAQSMAALAQTLKLLESRADSRLHQFEEERQQALLAASTLLRDRLDAAGIPLSAALDKPMTDEEWAQWRKGERGLFNRRTLSLLDRREARDLKAALEADPTLKEAAQRYVADFSALTARLPAMAPVLQSAEQGRIAAALQEALEA